jgi:hypothetical protein
MFTYIANASSTSAPQVFTLLLLHMWGYTQWIWYMIFYPPRCVFYPRALENGVACKKQFILKICGILLQVLTSPQIVMPLFLLSPFSGCRKQANFAGNGSDMNQWDSDLHVRDTCCQVSLRGVFEFSMKIRKGVMWLIDWLFTVLRHSKKYFTYMETSSLPVKGCKI